MGHVTKANYVQAIADFTSSIALDPRYANAYAQRGRVYLLNIDGEMDDAVSDLTKAVQLVPKEGAYQWFLTSALVETRRF